MEDRRVALMCGIDIPIPQLETVIHQPSIKEIAYIGEKDFFIGVQCLCLDKNAFLQGNFVPQDINNFQIFMTVMMEAEAKDKKNATQQLLYLLFPQCTKVLFTPRSLILQGSTGNLTIDEQTFPFVQEIVKDICCYSQISQSQGDFNPVNDKAKEIAAKLMRGRQRVAEQNGSANSSIFSQYLSSLTIGISSMSLKDLMDLTMFQLFDLNERYQLYINWDIDIRSRLAGAKPDGKPDNWMKNIH